MFQFAKFEKSKERRLATELGYSFQIGDPWITDDNSPWLKKHRLDKRYTSHQPNLDEKKKKQVHPYRPLFLM
ncbi:hypothetical protein RDI58_000907 [Solanum bulbocastanum]|uniref:Uncharacterized protein n=1 Tax=Solanum bulbocastanum TaxID=147425 RepID=A0AAN8U704_SOLBU